MCQHHDDTPPPQYQVGDTVRVLGGLGRGMMGQLVSITPARPLPYLIKFNERVL